MHTGDECAQSETALLARLAQRRMALSRASDVCLRMDRQPANGLRSTTPCHFAKTDSHRQSELFALLLQVEQGTGLPAA